MQNRIFQPKPPRNSTIRKKTRTKSKNLAGRREFAKVLGRMRAECDAWLRDIRDVSFTPELDMHRLTSGSTPYEFARDPQRYPLDRVLRLAAAAASGNTANVQEFVKDLRGENTVLQYWAAVGCRVLDAKAGPAREALAAAMKNSPSPSVRMAAAEVLCRLGESAGPLGVLQAYLTNEEPWTRMHAAVTLGRLGELNIR